jgi:3-hydroxyisobutyrate dehydrogenase
MWRFRWIDNFSMALKSACMSKIAFLGTGLLGSGFVQGLRSKDHEVVVWNRTAEKAAALTGYGAKVAATVAEAVAGAERVHLCLAADDAVDAVVAAIPVRAEQLLVDHSTTSPARTAERGARLTAEGRAFLHAPVFMSPAAAAKCVGIMLCAGPKALYERAQRQLSEMTGELRFVGEDFQRAAGLKLLGNSMLFAIAAGLADAFTIAAGCGLTPADVHEVLAQLKPAGSIDIRGRKMGVGDYTPSFELSMARKDMGLMLDAVGDRPLSSLRAIATRSDELIAAGHGAQDLGVLAIDVVPPLP